MSKTNNFWDRHRLLFAILLTTHQFASAQLTVPIGGTFTVPADSVLNLACTKLSVLGDFALGAGQLAAASSVEIAAGGNVSGGSGTLFVSGDWSNFGTFMPDASTVIFEDLCTAGPITISGVSVFNNLTLASSTGGTFALPDGTDITVNGTLTLLGAADRPMRLVSSSGSTAYITLGTGAKVVQNNAIIAGNVRIGSQAAHTASVPTLSAWSMILLALGMGLIPSVRSRKSDA